MTSVERFLVMMCIYSIINFNWKIYCYKFLGSCILIIIIMVPGMINPQQYIVQRRPPQIAQRLLCYAEEVWCEPGGHVYRNLCKT